jgi:natural product precursor
MKKISEINSMYPNIDSTNVLSDKDMNQVLGGGDCKSCVVCY